MPGEARIRVKVWDGWIRLFHWGLVALIGFSWWSAETGRLDWHILSGEVILALLLFRLAWGFLGSDTARFSRFLRSPVEGLRHLRHLHRREPDTEIGHNAAGGWMVLVLLGLILAQAVSGLFTDDGILARGPLARSVSPGLADSARSLHFLVFDLVLIAIGLHVLAVLAYAVLKRHDLVRPMVTGFKKLPAGFAARAPRMGSPWLALVLLALAAGVVTVIARQG
ncbi:cytochrome b/b6 domain-containing protein [Roseomonas sp. SSH11]|uniref:Cytochrome b/b6 domain-containing protein n=1 Tax=Pararoseomonas baculiformis TaxID=2820812 RepID=A0ABS4AES7_9PROT|nr:cytochrome b/b6 domain-containing protein [Pararoseomonas baculiformis]MBP0445512.1 cytochrome b/b6 domain-containing protein [Pararoseomonas baculiformis]